MSKTYETRANVHVPALKCSYPAGTRFVVKGEIVTIGDQEFEITSEFKLLIRHGIIRELTAEESKSPENVSEPKTLKAPERKKMPVVMEDKTIIPLETHLSKKAKESEDERIIKESNEADEGKTVRGMKVLSENSMPIKKLSSEESEKTSSKKELSESQKADIEARKNARVAAANAAIKANETKAKKPMSDAQKAALAKARAKAQEKREAQAKENNSGKGE